MHINPVKGNVLERKLVASYICFANMLKLYSYNDISLVFSFAYYLNLAFSQNLYFVRKQNNFVT